MKHLANTYRFFVDPALLATDALVLRDADLVRQLSRVLRLHAGDQIILLDGVGGSALVEITVIERDLVRGTVLTRTSSAHELALPITLYLALLRAERFEWALQKSVELGVMQIVPVQFSRSLPNERADGRKHERWQRIIREAAEQACRSHLPHLTAPLSFAAACTAAQAQVLRLILWEGTAPRLPALLRSMETPASIAIFSGPEGGITPDELKLASDHGIMPVSLGPRILRAETAPLAALAALGYQFDW